MKQGIKLKPCPFCNGTVDPEGWLCNDGTRGPECNDCGASARDLKTWNTRKAKPEGGMDK